MKVLYLRDANFKDVVLDQLFPQHDDAELDAQLDEAASWGTLRKTHTSFVPLFIIHHVLLIQPTKGSHRYKDWQQTSSNL